MRAFTKSPLFALLILAALIAGGSAARAQHAVAIVVDIDGKTSPALAANAEIPDKSVIALQPGTTLTLVHYKSCELLVVSGGRIAVEEGKYDVSGTKVVQEEKVSCPAEQQTTLANSNQASGTAALVLRSGEPGRTFIPLKPMVLAVGGKARDFVRVEILDGTNVVATLPLASGRAAWPAGTKPLVGYRKYTLRFVAAGGAAVSFPVTANPSLPQDGKAPTVFRLS
jgi:hypothetical protein